MGYVNPTKKQVQRVINNFKKIRGKANKEEAFDIGVGRVSVAPSVCGTVFCVAGWYAMANLKNKQIQKLITGNGCSYIDGANLMANHLGFINHVELEEWARDNADVWGANDGEFMFSSESAYTGLTKHSKKPMSIITKHWEAIIDRL